MSPNPNLMRLKLISSDPRIASFYRFLAMREGYTNAVLQDIAASGGRPAVEKDKDLRRFIDFTLDAMNVEAQALKSLQSLLDEEKPE